MVMGVNLWDFSPLRLFRLSFVVVSVFGVSFGPFIAMVSNLNKLKASKHIYQH